MRKGNDTFFYHYNAHGDVIALTDQQGKVVARYEYDAWGNPIKVEEDSVVADNPFRYAGYQYDKETGMYYLIARYYHPEHGVFLSLDPDPGDDDDILTQNGYTYANNNPVMLVDPDGHWVWLAINAGFAIYDGYKAYKSGKGWKGVAKAAALNFIGIGKVKKATKVVKAVDKGLATRGYKSKPGERTFKGFVKNNVSANKELTLHTKSRGFNTSQKNASGQFKRFGVGSHGGISPHVHQPIRNVNPKTGVIYGGTGRNGKGVTSPGKRDVKQLYQYLYNGKYR